MRKLFILLTTLLSINVFAGYFHEKVDVRLQANAGLGLFHAIGDDEPIGNENNLLVFNPMTINALVRSYVYKTEDYKVYVGGEISAKYNIFARVKPEPNIMELVPSVVVGFEEEKDELKFYQQLGIGLGYGQQYTFTYIDIASKLEFGLNYNNFIFSLGLEPKLGIMPLRHETKVLLHGNLALGLGYEF